MVRLSTVLPVGDFKDSEPNMVTLPDSESLDCSLSAAGLYDETDTVTVTSQTPDRYNIAVLKQTRQNCG